jgi:hypothetical protein
MCSYIDILTYSCVIFVWRLTTYPCNRRIWNAVQGQDFPTGNGASASDYFKLSNGSAIPDATITWVFQRLALVQFLPLYMLLFS